MTKRKLDLLKGTPQILINIPQNYKILAQMIYIYNHIAMNSFARATLILKNSDQARTVFFTQTITNTYFLQ